MLPKKKKKCWKERGILQSEMDGGAGVRRAGGGAGAEGRRWDFARPRGVGESLSRRPRAACSAPRLAAAPSHLGGELRPAVPCPPAPPSGRAVKFQGTEGGGQDAVTPGSASPEPRAGLWLRTRTLDPHGRTGLNAPTEESPDPSPGAYSVPRPTQLFAHSKPERTSAPESQAGRREPSHFNCPRLGDRGRSRLRP